MFFCLYVSSVKTKSKSLNLQPEGRDHFTVKVAPARDVTGCPGGEHLSSLWETRHPHAVRHDGALVQFQQGQVIARRQTNVTFNNNLHSDQSFITINVRCIRYSLKSSYIIYSVFDFFLQDISVLLWGEKNVT